MLITNSRRMNALEETFVNQENNVFIQLALEVDHPRNLSKMLEKIKNSTAGLYIKSDGTNFINNYQEPNSVVVHKIPKTNKTLFDCCEWIYKEFTPSSTYSLASIAADETRVVINSNHALTDGGYFANLLENIQNPKYDDIFCQKSPIPKDLQTDLFKREFDNFLAKYDKNRFPLLSKSRLTHYDKQDSLHPPNSYNKIPPRLKAEIKVEELSHSIFDRSSQKVHQLTEFLWIGLCMAISAKNRRFGPVGVGTCMDFRRLKSKDRINSSFGNTFTNFFVFVKEANPKMTIYDLCQKFREKFNKIKNTDLFYKEYLFPSDYAYENCPVSYVSNVGPIKIGPPIKDFYVQCSSKEIGIRDAFLVTSYSKVNLKSGENEVILNLRFSPYVVSCKDGNDVFDTYIHFLKNVDASMKYGDVLDELINFQDSLE